MSPGATSTLCDTCSFAPMIPDRPTNFDQSHVRFISDRTALHGGHFAKQTHRNFGLDPVDVDVYRLTIRH